MSHGRFSNEPPEDPDESGESGASGPAGQNPFAGTPLEGLLGGLGGMAGQGGVPDLSALMAQMQTLMQPYDGVVNWALAKDLARRTTAASPDPSPGQREKDAVADALRLADHWLDEVTTFPSGISATAAWSRAEWVEETMPVWQTLVTPVAENVVAAMTRAMPEEARTMAGPLLGLLGKAAGAMFGMQIGQAVGTLAGEVLTASDVGLPLGPVGKAALLPANVAEFGEGLDVSLDDVRLYLALREAAHQRLFAHVPWLREHLVGAVDEFGRGTTIDTSAIESRLTGLDPTNPQGIQEALEGGLFEPERTPAQEAALTRLETVLALVEGWVDEVVGQATEGKMPSAAKLQEAVRRRRAAGGPAEATFASLVGLELRPRRLRDASALWGSLRSRQGVDARDAVWLHPDLLPTPADLDDPLGFREHLDGADRIDDDAFDAALTDLLSKESGPDDATGDR